MFSRLRTNFFTGLLVITPLMITLWVIYFITIKLNQLLLEPVMDILRIWVKAENLELLTKLFIFIVFLMLITFVGFATRLLIFRNIFGFGEKLLYRVPMISPIYKAAKDIFSAFFLKKDAIFKKVVLVEYPRKGIYSIGFMTADTIGPVGDGVGRPAVNVFVPSTPNPTTGMMILVPVEEVIELDISVSEAVKMILSGGAVNPAASIENTYHGNSKDRGSAVEKEGPERD